MLEMLGTLTENVNIYVYAGIGLIGVGFFGFIISSVAFAAKKKKTIESLTSL